MAERKRNPDGTFAPADRRAAEDGAKAEEVAEAYEEHTTKGNTRKAIAEGRQKSMDAVGTEADLTDLSDAVKSDGLTESEAGGRLEELLKEADSLQPEALETLSADERQALKERAEESGEIEDAARFLEEQMKAEEAEEQAEGESSREPVPFDQLSEELGISEDDVLVSVKVQGEESEVPLSEAIKGFQLESTFTRKSQELAEKRKEVEKLEEDHAQALEMIATTLGQHLDPQTQQAVVERYNTILSNVAQRNQAAMQEAAAESREKLRESFGWEDDGEWDVARQAMRSYAEREYGFSPEEMSRVTDHRIYEVLEKARRYDREVKGKKPSPTLKPGQGNRNPAKEARQKSGVSDARKRLKQTGSVDDAAAALQGILD